MKQLGPSKPNLVRQWVELEFQGSGSYRPKSPIFHIFICFLKYFTKNVWDTLNLFQKIIYFYKKNKNKNISNKRREILDGDGWFKVFLSIIKKLYVMNIKKYEKPCINRN